MFGYWRSNSKWSVFCFYGWKLLLWSVSVLAELSVVSVELAVDVFGTPELLESNEQGFIGIRV